MTDIVERLRDLDLGIPQEIYAMAQEAANDIERLRTIVGSYQTVLGAVIKGYESLKKPPAPAPSSSTP